MNDTIMATLAAAKSQQAKLHSTKTSAFRSVRENAGQKVKQVHKIKTTQTRLPDVDALHVMLGSDIHRQLREQSSDPIKLVQQIVKEHLERTTS